MEDFDYNPKRRATGLPVVHRRASAINNCFTAESDIRVLQSEKANVAQQMAAGIAAIVPTSIVVGLVTGTEGTKAQVESGEYNRKIDARIAEIKSTCGVN